MDRAEFTLSRPVCLSLPVEEVDKLLREKDGRILYFLQKLFQEISKNQRPF